MKLQPGFPIVVFPTFHMPVDLRERVTIGAGIERDGEAFVPKAIWRRPDEQEFAWLLHPVVPMQAVTGLFDSLCLFQLPQHLRLTWWKILESAAPAGMSRLDGFDQFVIDISAFLNFKDIGVPPGANFELLLTKPGQRSLGHPGRPAGLALHGTTQNDTWWGGINLADEPTSLVFVNLIAAVLCAELERSHPDAVHHENQLDLAARLLTNGADYPLVRLRIDPGEGFRLPSGGILVDGDPSENQEPSLLLLITTP